MPERLAAGAGAAGRRQFQVGRWHAQRLKRIAFLGRAEYLVKSLPARTRPNDPNRLLLYLVDFTGGVSSLQRKVLRKFADKQGNYSEF